MYRISTTLKVYLRNACCVRTHFNVAANHNHTVPTRLKIIPLYSTILLIMEFRREMVCRILPLQTRQGQCLKIMSRQIIITLLATRLSA